MPTALDISEIVRNYAIVIGGVVGFAIAIWRAVAADRQARAQMLQAEQGRRAHVMEIFGGAIEGLDNDKMHIRLGATYTMREIVDSYRDLSRPTVDLLTAYLAGVSYESDEPPQDVQEIMRIVIPRRVNVVKR